jgi:prepilin-type processing-associated H-X9-DG protein
MITNGSPAPLSKLTSPAVTVALFETFGGTVNFSAGGLQSGSPSGNGGAVNDCGSMPTWADYDTGNMGNPAASCANHVTSPNDTMWGPYGRHSNGSNFLLCDGHVKWLLPQAVSPGDAPTGANCSAGANATQWLTNCGYTSNAAGTAALSTGGFQATFSTL